VYFVFSAMQLYYAPSIPHLACISTKFPSHVMLIMAA